MDILKTNEGGRVFWGDNNRDAYFRVFRIFRASSKRAQQSMIIVNYQFKMFFNSRMETLFFPILAQRTQIQSLDFFSRP